MSDCVRERARVQDEKSEVERLQAEVDRLTKSLQVSEAIAWSLGYPLKSPFCEHSSIYSYTDDGGKHIRCLVCCEKEAIDKLAQQLADNLKLQAEIDRLKSLQISCDQLAVEHFIEMNRRECSNCDHEFVDLTAYYAGENATHFLVADDTERVEAICARCLAASPTPEIERLTAKLDELLEEPTLA